MSLRGGDISHQNYNIISEEQTLCDCPKRIPGVLNFSEADSRMGVTRSWGNQKWKVTFNDDSISVRKDEQWPLLHGTVIIFIATDLHT